MTIMGRLAPKAIREAKKLAQQGQRLLEKAIVNDAKDLLRRHPLANSYTQAMGSATVNVTLGGRSFELSLDSGCDEIQRNYLWDDLDDQTRISLNSLDGALKELQKLHDAWSDLYPGYLAGNPVHIDKKLTVTTDW